jgi:hypothetical protein
MIVIGNRFIHLLVSPAFGRNVDLTTQYRLHFFCLSLLEKIHGPENVPMIGKSHGRHFMGIGGIDKSGYFASPIQDAVLGMIVKMDKR